MFATHSSGRPKISFQTLGKLFVFIAIFTLIISALIYYIFSSILRNALIEQVRIRNQSIAKAGGQSFSTFIELYSSSLSILAANQEIVYHSQKSQSFLDSFVEGMVGSFISGVLVADKDGVPVFLSTKTGGSLRADNPSVADRDYFIWAKTAERGEVFIGEPIISRIEDLGNQYIITIASPLIKNGEFNGVLASSLLLKQLADKYLGSLIASKNTMIYIIDSEGTILYSTFESLIGKNDIKYLKEKPFIENELAASILKERAKNKEAGELEIVLPNEKKRGSTRFFISYAPIVYDSQSLVLAVAIPEDEILSLLYPSILTR